MFGKVRNGLTEVVSFLILFGVLYSYIRVREREIVDLEEMAVLLHFLGCYYQNQKAGVEDSVAAS